MNLAINEAIHQLSKYNVIFSGSYVLRAYRLLPEDRAINDIDLVFKTEEAFKEFIDSSESTILPLDKEAYDDKFYKVNTPLFAGITIDCFINPNVETVNFATDIFLTSMLMQNPRQILQQKLGILYDRVGRKDSTYSKHLADFNHIFKPAE